VARRFDRIGERLEQSTEEMRCPHGLTRWGPVLRVEVRQSSMRLAGDSCHR
jgi:hypothetical protein